jgi:hypothetical protein
MHVVRDAAISCIQILRGSDLLSALHGLAEVHRGRHIKDAHDAASADPYIYQREDGRIAVGAAKSRNHAGRRRKDCGFRRRYEIDAVMAPAPRIAAGAKGAVAPAVAAARSVVAGRLDVKPDGAAWRGFSRGVPRRR